MGVIGGLGKIAERMGLGDFGLRGEFEHKNVGPEVMEALEQVLAPEALNSMRAMIDQLNNDGVDGIDNREFTQSQVSENLYIIAEHNNSEHMTDEMRDMLRSTAEDLVVG